MMTQVSVLSQIANKPKIVRPKVNYHPNIWGDRFLNNGTDHLEESHELRKQKVEELKEVVRREVFVVACCDPSNQLKLIDSIERLGLSYQFESEMEEALGQIYATYINGQPDDDKDLHDAALRFRLLRQHGYTISCDLFAKFKDDGGKFKESLVEDTLGMLSLYEASHMRLHGEAILDEALGFTTTHLDYLFANQKAVHPLSAEITRALKRPLRKSVERLQARHYISVYQDQASHNKSLLELAKLDFNLVQSLHKKELSEIYRWWKELDISTKLPYARDRIMEVYVYWALGVYFEPKQSLGRSILSKAIMLASVVDDTYDAYGTFEELELFTEAIQRWDINCVEQLPDYMQLLYRAILKAFEEFEEEMEDGQRYQVHYGKEALKTLVRAYMKEARWLRDEYVPTLEEYLDVTMVSSCYYMLTTVSFMGMKDNNITKNVFEWVSEDPKIVRASSIICRLMDDIASHKFEQKRHHIPSAVECYKKQYKVSEKEAYDELNRQVEDAWKDTNQDLLRPTAVPMPLLALVLNFSRVIDLIYKDGDEFSHVGEVGKQVFAALVIEPVP